MWRTGVILLLAGLVVAVLAWWARPPAPATATSSLIPMLSEANTAGFAQATAPDAFVFPRDFGPHEDFQTEWWYYTGNLETEAGRPFGFQFTIFRNSLTATPAADSASAWRSNQVYLAHFTISDIEGGAFYPYERFSRGAAGLAGAQSEPYGVWLNDWRITTESDGRVRLQASTDETALDLYLTQTLPPIAHGDGGLSQKGAEPGNASYYYSQVRQSAVGQITIGAETFTVRGLAWKDHEYSTSALSPGVVGWDWFSLQFDDGSALMFFQIRRESGALEPYSSGTFIAADGTTTAIAREAWELDITSTWRSPHSGGRYPAGWRLSVAPLALELTGEPQLADQELNVSTTYWEGAVRFTGTRDGEPRTAVGYVEMTGYAGAP